ncbi:hypothetical protein RB595_008555 [Gaeumannomyces hyphopodioides]
MANPRDDGRFRYYDEPPEDLSSTQDTAPLLEIEVDDTVAGVSDAGGGDGDDGDDGDDGRGLPGARKGWPHGGATHAQSWRRHRWYQVRSPRAVVATVALMLSVMLLGAMVLLIPLARLVEDDLCRRHYGTEAPVPEEKCKVDEVQMRLAWLGGCAGVVNAITELVVSFPWGLLADRFGRKPILRASFAGIIMSICWSCFVISRPDLMPVELTLLGSLFAVFGGGPGTAVTVIHAIIADVATDKASAFMWTSIGAISGVVIGPALAAHMMQSASSPWVPVRIAGMTLIPILLATVILPETKPAGSAVGAGTVSDSNTNEGFWKTLRARLSESLSSLRSSVHMLRRASILCVMPSFFVTQPVATVQGATLGLTLSKKFGWRMAQLGYFFSVRGLLTILVLALLPLLIKSCKDGGGGVGRDLHLARASMLFMLLGNLLTGLGLEAVPLLAAGQLASTLSVGSGSLSRSLLAGLADGPDQTARLYALAGMVETVGSLVAGPSLPWAFGLGVRAGGAWMGIPFWFVAVLCALALAALLCVRRDGPGGGCGADDSERAEGVANRGSDTEESEGTLVDI